MFVGSGCRSVGSSAVRFASSRAIRFYFFSAGAASVAAFVAAVVLLLELFFGPWVSERGATVQGVEVATPVYWDFVHFVSFTVWFLVIPAMVAWTRVIVLGPNAPHPSRETWNRRVIRYARRSALVWAFVFVVLGVVVGIWRYVWKIPIFQSPYPWLVVSTVFVLYVRGRASPYLASVCFDEPIGLRRALEMTRGNGGRLFVCQLILYLGIGALTLAIAYLVGDQSFLGTLARAYVNELGDVVWLAVDAWWHFDGAPLVVYAVPFTLLHVIQLLIIAAMDGRVYAFLREKEADDLVSVFD